MRGIVCLQSTPGTECAGSLCVSARVMNYEIVYADVHGCCACRDKGLELGREMALTGVEPNAVTRQLLSAIGRGGAACVGDAHLAVTALTAAVAAAGSLAMRSGLF